MQRISGLLVLLTLLVGASVQDRARHEPSSGSQNRNSITQLGNVSEIINLLLVGYDIRLRPGFGGPPLNITIDLVIASFDEISEVNMDYTLTLYLHQHWKDERLAFSEGNDYELTLGADFADKIWTPDSFLANDKNSFLHEVTEKNKMIRLKSNGEISYGMRFSSVLACMMDLHYYPLDTQNCTIEIESYGYTVSDLVMLWRPLTPVVGIQEAKLSQFKIISHSAQSSNEELATGVYQRLRLTMTFQRQIFYFIFQTYLPSTLIVLISMLGFWINSEATSARVGLGISAVLTITTISAGVRSTLPRISYVKAIDIYLFVCFIFVFSALLEYSAVNYSYWTSRVKKKSLKKTRADLQSKLDKNERKFGQTTDAMPNGGQFHAQQQQPSELDSIDEQLRTTIMNADDYLLSAALSAPPLDHNQFTSDLNELNTSLQLNAAELNLNALNNLINHQTYDVNNLIINNSHQPIGQTMSQPMGQAMGQQSNYAQGLNNLNALGQQNSSSLPGLSGSVYPEFDSILPNQPQSDGNLNQFREHVNKFNQRLQQENTIELLLKKRLKLLQSLRRLSKFTKVKNVNKIDKYSRILFPSSFLLFNVVYWTFYKF